MKNAEKCSKVDLVKQDVLRYTRPPALKNTRERHNRKILFSVSVEEHASHLLVSKFIAGLMTDNSKPKSAIVMLVERVDSHLLCTYRWMDREGGRGGREAGR